MEKVLKKQDYKLLEQQQQAIDEWRAARQRAESERANALRDANKALDASTAKALTGFNGVQQYKRVVVHNSMRLGVKSVPVVDMDIVDVDYKEILRNYMFDAFALMSRQLRNALCASLPAAERAAADARFASHVTFLDPTFRRVSGGIGHLNSTCLGVVAA